MFDTTTAREVQPASKPGVELEDRVEEVRDIINDLAAAIYSLEDALKQLNDEGYPEDVRDLASIMGEAARELRWEFDCSDLHQVDELEELAGEEAACHA